MLVLFTDFGPGGPYVGQLQAVLQAQAPSIPVINLIDDAPRFKVLPAAHLLAAFISQFPVDTVFVCVVDPEVGGARQPVILHADGQYFVGPGNGLMDVVAARAKQAQWSEILWRPPQLSTTFHGRDLFAPVAAKMATAQPVEQRAWSPQGVLNGADLAEVIYLDHYGNGMTGLRQDQLSPSQVLRVGNHPIPHAKTFSAVPLAEAFYYVNSIGLIEVAVNQGNAARELPMRVGDLVGIEDFETAMRSNAAWQG